MPLGDTITKGPDANPWGYRWNLYDNLLSLGYAVDYVGTRLTNPLSSSIPLDLERNHQAFGGQGISFFIQNMPSWLNNISYPDVILVLLGTVDFTFDSDTNNAIARLDTLINTIVSMRPYTHIIASNLLVRKEQNIDQAIQSRFNPYVQKLVQNHTALGHRVSYLDMRSVISLNLLDDNVNPNADGYVAMAKTWAQAIQNVTGPYGSIYRPSIVSARNLADYTSIVVQFSKPIRLPSTSSFSIDQGVKILSANIHDNPFSREVRLLTSDLSKLLGKTVSISVTGVTDQTPANRTILSGTSVVCMIRAGGSLSPTISPTVFPTPAVLTPLPTLSHFDKPPVRIMPMGDSITKGHVKNPWGYRWDLYTLLSARGYNVDYVGNRVTNPWSPDIPPGLEREHEGNGGKEIQWFEDSFEDILRDITAPDIILMLLGTVDFGQNISTSTAINRLDHFIGTTVARLPYTHIIVSNLLNRLDPEINVLVQTQFNPFIEDVVQRHADNGEKVYFIDLKDVIPLNMYADLIHPNTQGYKLMAEAWANAIKVIWDPYGDHFPPDLINATTFTSYRRISLVFSKPVQLTDSTKITIDRGVTATSLMMDNSQRIVFVDTSSYSRFSGLQLRVSVDGIRDQTSLGRWIELKTIIVNVPGSLIPTAIPTRVPTKRPSRRPTLRPTIFPVRVTFKPSLRPVLLPTPKLTSQPSKRPTRKPTKRPTRKPSKRPTRKPSRKPTRKPSKRPTRKPSKQPTRKPSKRPTRKPSRRPTRKPTRKPTRRPVITRQF